MKTLITRTSLVLLLCGSAYGQTFNSGSTGADGAFTFVDLFQPSSLPAGTALSCADRGNGPELPCTAVVPLREPPNHIFNFTTVTIGANVTVKFKPNAANTPVFILASGDVIINGTIDVSGEGGEGIIAPKGGPGGFSGGMGVVLGASTNIGGAGNGPGGGGGSIVGNTIFHGGRGNFSGSYGTQELQSLIGGSGGGGEPLGAASSVRANNGSGSGGGLLIAASGVIDVGSGTGSAIRADGGSNFFASAVGSGGAIRLVTTVLRGSRQLTAVSPDTIKSNVSFPTGRIRLEAAQANQYTGTTNPAATFNPPGQPITVFPPITPTIRIVSIGGVSLPAQPTAAAHTPDIALPAQSLVPGFYPVNIELEATNVPSGTLAKVLVGPQFGAGDRIITPPVALTGPVGQPKRATVQVNLPPSGVGIISALIDSVVPEP